MIHQSRYVRRKVPPGETSLLGNDGANLHRSVALQDGTAFGQFYRLVEVLGLDEQLALDRILDLDVRTIGDNLALASDNFSRSIQPFRELLKMAVLFQHISPSHPLLHGLLHLLGGHGPKRRGIISE